MAISVIGGLAVFLFGMVVMSEGLQKIAGPKMRKILSAMTGNRFLGVLTGITITSVIQSSSATTVMLVSFVHAGLISLVQSIGVIMGANIGTTMTAWLVALVGFKVKVTALALPAVSIGFFVRFFKNERLTEWGQFLIGFGILFLGLDLMKEAVSELKESPSLLAWMSATQTHTLGWRLLTVAIGGLVTVLVQSSSATMAITMTLAAQGIIGVDTACALCIGENIGTTITANLAAIGTSTAARRAAFAHFAFNILGALWAILLFNPFFRLVDAIVPGQIGEGVALSQVAIATRLAAFHSIFNLVNTALHLPFVNQIAWLATKMRRQTEKETRPGLRYIDPTFVGIPATAIHAGRSEFGAMVGETEAMLNGVLTLISSPGKKLGNVADSISKSEQVVDSLEKEITAYLVAVSQLEISEAESREIAGIINAAHDVERIGDHCEVILRLLRRLHDSKIVFGDDAVQQALDIGVRAQSFVKLIRENVFNPRSSLMDEARALELVIDGKRDELRQGHIARLREGTGQVDGELVFIDMVTSFEKIGDHAYNVAQVLAGQKKKLQRPA
jgi:phosphate:Na+ symporter